jgi:hypothetical protein
MDGIGGPLFLLRWKGAICSCLESTEDASARRSLQELTNLRVKWHRKGLSSSISSTLSSWFGGAGGAGSSAKDAAVSKDAIDAVLLWVDTDKGPELQIKPQQAATTGADGEITLKQSAGYMKSIPLSKVDVVRLQESSLTLQTDKGVDLVSIEIVGKDATAIRDCFILMIEWDGRRRAAIPEEDREAEDPAMSRAQKVAHFAKREIELQQTKRDREKGKAKLVKETGGLKYTAIAMANRMEE